MNFKFIKHIFLFFLFLLLGMQNTYAKTELSLTKNNVYFSIEQNKSLEKEVQPNIGLLKEKCRFVVSESISAQNPHEFSEYFVRNVANGVDDLFTSFTHLKNLSPDFKAFLSTKNWDNAILTKLDGDLANTTFKNAIDTKPPQMLEKN